MTMVGYWIRRRLMLTVALCLLVSLVGCLDASEQSIDWPTRRDSGDVGVSGDCFFYTGNKKPFSLEIWQWTDNTVKKARVMQFDKEVTSAATLSPDLWVCDLYAPKHESEFCVVNVHSGETVHRWKPPYDWYIELCQGSRNSEYVAAWSQPERYSREPRDMVRFGLLAPDEKSFNWIATVSKAPGDSPGAMIHHVVPSDDGVYIGVAGWKWGVVMIDVAKKKISWAASSKYQPEMKDSFKKPKVPWQEVPFDEVDTNDLAFTPDGKLIFAGGTTGLVYGMKTETGEIVSQWWATLSGESEPGHYIRRVAVSPDGKFVAAGTVPNGLVFLFSAKDGHRYTLNHGRSAGIDLLGFSPDSKRLASYAAGQIKIWKLPEDAEEPQADKPDSDKTTTVKEPVTQ